MTSPANLASPSPAAVLDTSLVYAFTVGSLRCKSLSDGFITVPVPFLAPEIPPDQVKALMRESGHGEELLHNPISCLLVTFPDGRTVIVDSGLGRVPGSEGVVTPTAGRLPDALAEAGVDRESVRTVLVSHIHPDHVGGLFDAAGEPLFPNAEYVVSRQEAEFWRAPDTDLGGTLMPPPRRAQVIAIARRFLERAAPRLRLFEAGEPALEGVDTQLLAGHTPGQVGFLFDGGDAKLFYTADAGGHPIVSLERPEWRFGFDTDAEVAIETRRALVAQLSRTGVQIFTPHFPWPSFGHVETRGGKPVWIPGADTCQMAK